MQEMNALTVDLGDELRVPVEQRLLAAPVISVAPIPGQVLEVAHRDALGPRIAGQLIRPPRPVEPR